jgi:hypothetical protein
MMKLKHQLEAEDAAEKEKENKAKEIKDQGSKEVQDKLMAQKQATL